MTAPFLPTAADTKAAQAQLEQVRTQASQIPARLAEVLEELLGHLAAGKAVQVVTLDAEISTQQAADLLNVSRPYLVKLVDEGALPHRKVGPRRRLYLEDVLAYKARLDDQRQQALQALTDDLQEMGLDSMGPVSLLDASVLYPSLIRNLLMHLATAGLISARWTDQIHQEWMGNLLSDRPDLTLERLERTRRFMEAAVPDATVSGYGSWIPTLALPDPNDRHVLAAAITAEADLIVTWNLKDFPLTAVQGYGLDVLSPDDLMVRLLLDTPGTTGQALEALRISLRRPPYSRPQFVQRLAQVGLTKMAQQLGV